MLLGEYFRMRCGNDKLIGLAVSSLEMKNYKIPDNKHGWLKRVKDYDIADDVIVDTCNKLIKKSSNKPRILTRLVAIRDSLTSNGTPAESDKSLVGKTYLYIMKNEIGMYKVGVSKTPQSRARCLSTGSGLDVKLISYYYGTEPALDIESHILSKLDKHRKLGEWFKPNSVTLEEIVALLPNSYVKVN